MARKNGAVGPRRAGASGYAQRVSQSFERARFVLPSSLEEELGAALWAAGTLGLETRGGATGTMVIDAWFADGTLREDAFRHWRTRGVTVTQETVASQDYLAAYRAQAQPIDIGERFRIDPRDVDDDVDAANPCGGASAARGERFGLHIPARVAFGTGSHETTRLVLRLLETTHLDGGRVLDIGCGSGILSFAALRLGAREVTGFDLDTPSALVAGQNAALNPWPRQPRFYAGRLDALVMTARFDLIAVNVLPMRIRDDLPRLAQALAPGGRVLSAGALTTERDTMLASWAAVGLTAEAEAIEGEWIGFVLAGGDRARGDLVRGERAP